MSVHAYIHTYIQNIAERNNTTNQKTKKITNTIHLQQDVNVFSVTPMIQNNQKETQNDHKEIKTKCH